MDLRIITNHSETSFSSLISMMLSRNCGYTTISSQCGYIYISLECRWLWSHITSIWCQVITFFFFFLKKKELLQNLEIIYNCTGTCFRNVWSCIAHAFVNMLPDSILTVVTSTHAPPLSLAFSGKKGFCIALGRLLSSVIFRKPQQQESRSDRASNLPP